VTLLLSSAEVAALMTPANYLEAVERGFGAAMEGKAAAPAPLTLAGEGGAFHAKGATLFLGRPYVAVKLNGNFPANPPALPTIQGAILLCDASNGALLAVIDSIEVTVRRTAAATALAARYLARADSSTLLLCGCGAQAPAQLEALAAILPLRRCVAWDRDPAKAEALARTAERSGLEAEAVTDLGPAARSSDVIVTCTTAREPFLEASHVAPGTFVAAVGADSPDKNEIGAGLMAAARIVVDLLEQCLAMGDLRHAVRTRTMAVGDVHASLGDLVAGARPGRTGGDEVFVFDSTGTALQDVAAAAAIYERALRRGGYAAFDFAAAG
jgi:alanine dehydrogenase